MSNPERFFDFDRSDHDGIERRARGIAEFRHVDPDEALTALLAERQDELADALVSDDPALD